VDNTTKRITFTRQIVHAKEKKSANPQHDRSPNSRQNNLHAYGKTTFVPSQMWIALDYYFQQRSPVVSFGDLYCPVGKIEISPYDLAMPIPIAFFTFCDRNRVCEFRQTFVCSVRLSRNSPLSTESPTQKQLTRSDFGSINWAN
jgi:hypothetical protein